MITIRPLHNCNSSQIEQWSLLTNSDTILQSSSRKKVNVDRTTSTDATVSERCGNWHFNEIRERENSCCWKKYTWLELRRVWGVPRRGADENFHLFIFYLFAFQRCDKSERGILLQLGAPQSMCSPSSQSTSCISSSNSNSSSCVAMNQYVVQLSSSVVCQFWSGIFQNGRFRGASLVRRVLRHGPLWTRQLPETGIKPILKIYSTICAFVKVAFLVCYMTYIRLLYKIHWTIFCGERKSSIFNWLGVQQAKAMGTKLIVGVHTDAEIAKHKVGKPGNLI